MKTYGREHCVRPTFAERAELGKPWVFGDKPTSETSGDRRSNGDNFRLCQNGVVAFFITDVFFSLEKTVVFPVRRELGTSKTAVVHALGFLEISGLPTSRTSDFMDFRLRGSVCTIRRD